MDRFLNTLKGQSAALDQGSGQPRFGVVTSVDPGSYTARVTLQPEGVLTGWLPILSPWTGTGWGIVCPPTPGDQVLVLPQEGDAEHGVIVGRNFSDRQRPPVGDAGPVPAGELHIVHATGTRLRLGNDGSVTIAAQGSVTINATQPLRIEAPEIDLAAATVKGGDLSAATQRLATEEFVLGLFNAHTHPDAHGGETGTPLQQAGDQHLTGHFHAS